MTFWEHFLRVLPHRPTSALAALYWHLTRRRLRARNRLRKASVDLPFAYAFWIERTEKNGELARDAAVALEHWASPPSFSILLHASEQYSEQQLKRSIESLERQIYPFWTVVEDSTDELETRIAKADGDFLVPLRIGDALSKASLYRFAETIQNNPGAAIFYGDEDELDGQGQRRRPWFKPRWNQEMFLAQDYLSGAAAIEMGLARQSARNAKNVAEMVLSASLRAESPIVHVPHIICHAASRPENQDSRISSIARYLEPLGATCAPGPFDTVKVEWPLPPEPPLVSIIIPTKDKLEFLRPCVDTVLTRTSYANFELLVIDNDSIEQRTADYLAEIETHPRVRVLSYPAPYNFSAINNFAAEQASGSYLCLLNNDTEVIEGDWLTEMVRYAVRPEVGAVGAKLLYDDRSLQHAGVVIGIGEAAGHAHRFLPAGQPGYFRQAHVAQFVSAVTAACLVVDKSKFQAVGGFDAAELAVAFNDVDFCLKLEAKGWRNVYVPHAVLVHHESKSRGNDTSPLNIDRYRKELGVLQARWGTKTYSDPLHNPNLDRYSETFVIGL